MAKITKGTNFPHELESELFSLIKGKSSLARLSGSEPLPFVGKDIFTFNFSNKLSICIRLLDLLDVYEKLL